MELKVRTGTGNVGGRGGGGNGGGGGGRHVRHLDGLVAARRPVTAVHVAVTTVHVAAAATVFASIRGRYRKTETKIRSAIDGFAFCASVYTTIYIYIYIFFINE